MYVKVNYLFCNVCYFLNGSWILILIVYVVSLDLCFLDVVSENVYYSFFSYCCLKMRVNKGIINLLVVNYKLMNSLK